MSPDFTTDLIFNMKVPEMIFPKKHLLVVSKMLVCKSSLSMLGETVICLFSLKSVRDISNKELQSLTHFRSKAESYLS